MDTQLLVKLGAKARLAELDLERADLLKVLNGRPIGAKKATPVNPNDKRRKPMSAAKRKALSIKLKAWHAAHPAGAKK